MVAVVVAANARFIVELPQPLAKATQFAIIKL